MKSYKWLYGVIAAGLLAGCSDADSPSNDNNGGKDGATGYLALSINLPKEISTRAEGDNSGTADNVEFADGDAWEYKVHDAKLLLFKTESADALGKDAKFLSSYDLKRAFSDTDPSNDQISASSVEAVAVNIDDPEAAYLWALVMLNVPEGLTMPQKNELFSDYLKKTSEVSFIKTAESKNYIFMTNAPLSKNKGGGTTTSPTANASIFTLTPLGKASDALHPTLQQAREHVAGCVYVERGVAKVTATIDPNVAITMNGKADESGEYTAINVTIDVQNSFFGLDHINKSSYIVRNVVDFPASLTNEANFAWNLRSGVLTETYYRMIGNSGMPTYANHPLLHNEVDPQLYRTYWCADPNYAVQMGEGNKTAESDFKKIGNGALYAKENTFPVQNMNYGNTTLAIFKLTLKVDGSAKDLFIINEDHNVVYTSEKDATSFAYQYVLAQDIVAAALNSSKKSGVTAGIDKLAEYLKIEFELDPATGIYSATGITLDTEGADYGEYFGNSALTTFQQQLPATNIQEFVDRINTLYVINKYTGGVSYYVLPIMHFGEESTPWTKTAGENQTDTEDAYADAEGGKYNAANYLGRYGMVRNNWYEINVKTIKGIGSPVVPTISYDDDTSDDNNEVKQYIGVETHILSWAKRLQEGNL